MAPRARPAGTLHLPAPGASERIARQLRRHLDERRLRPGDRIGTEQQLADEFGVSRPTVREASQLIRVGRGRAGGIFVARTPNEGMSRNLSETIGLMLAAESVSMEELLDARLSLEVPLAGRAAVNADEGVVARLEEAVAAAVAHARARRPLTRPTRASTRSSPRRRATTSCAV
jgi:DNA-binding FadR family transcriptional regulator